MTGSYKGIPFGIMVWWSEVKNASFYDIEFYLDNTVIELRKLGPNNLWTSFTNIADFRYYYLQNSKYVSNENRPTDIIYQDQQIDVIYNKRYKVIIKALDKSNTLLSQVEVPCDVLDLSELPH
ncbi:MAG: hypothetical protein LBV58_02190 [Acholeplasmatales bacterium]|jgi:hypothetical protein|nr:hypothetical protein [Acholeplasmatales bacterium]